MPEITRAQRYRLNSDISAISTAKGKPAVVTIPANATLTVFTVPSMTPGSWMWSGTVKPAWCSHRTLKPTPNASRPKSVGADPRFVLRSAWALAVPLRSVQGGIRRRGISYYKIEV